jgi:predicted TIM-barrel fold metal-dependent hydrolase
LTPVPVDAHDAPAPGWDSHVHVFDAQAPVAPGHYTPVYRPLAAIEALAQANGVGHLVLVQPSVYGTDNTVLLHALRASRGRHRGVVVIDPTVSDVALQDMHALGVRGVRFNLVSPVGNRGNQGSGDNAGRGDHGDVQQPLVQQFHALAPRLQALGWHVQWYAQPQDLPAIAGLHADGPSGLVAVLDHLAGLHAGLSPHHPAWQAVARLAGLGAWVKLSGWYRLQAMAPYGALDDAIRRVAALFDDRMVWGSDWPHTAFAPEALPDYATTWAPVARVLSAAKKNRVCCAAAASLYA